MYILKVALFFNVTVGFEDVSLLKDLFLEFDGDLEKIVKEFTDRRWKDVHAIADLAMYNYIEMRDLVTRRSFLLRKKIDTFLYFIFGDKWVPLYNTVSFTKLPYSKCIENRNRQDQILYCSSLLLFFTLALLFIFKIFY